LRATSLSGRMPLPSTTEPSAVIVCSIGYMKVAPLGRFVTSPTNTIPGLCSPTITARPVACRSPANSSVDEILKTSIDQCDFNPDAALCREDCINLLQIVWRNDTDV